MTWLKGYTKAEATLDESINYWRSVENGRTELIKGPGLDACGEWVPRNTFPDYWNDDLWSSIYLWKNWKQFGMPFAIGWADHPAWIVDAISTVDTVIKDNHDGSNR